MSRYSDKQERKEIFTQAQPHKPTKRNRVKQAPVTVGNHTYYGKSAKKARKRLSWRMEKYEMLTRNSKVDSSGFTKPGSFNK